MEAYAQMGEEELVNSKEQEAYVKKFHNIDYIGVKYMFMHWKVSQHLKPLIFQDTLKIKCS